MSEPTTDNKNSVHVQDKRDHIVRDVITKLIDTTNAHGVAGAGQTADNIIVA